MNRQAVRWVLVMALLIPVLAPAQTGPASPAEAGADPELRDAGLEQGPVSNDAWLGLLGALVGAGIGFGAAVFAVSLTNREAKRQHAEAVRIARVTILGEVEVNRENFATDWSRVHESHEPADVAPVNRAGMYPAPPVITTAWESQIGLVPEGFAADEVLALHRFYASARTAVAVREGIQQLYVSDMAQQSRNEAFSIYRLHAERVMEFALPAADSGPPPFA